MWSSQHLNRCVVRKQWRCWDGRNAYSRCAADARRTDVRGISDGRSFEEAAAAVRCSTKTVQRLLNTIPPRKPTRSKRHLSLAEREEARGLGSGASYRAIARRLGRAPSTICREVNGNSGPCRYRACRADEAAYKRARRPKATKFRQCPRLRTQVESMLNAQWSPQQISARLTVDYPDDPEMRVSHETIYRSLFVQARGALRKELTACLRSGRTRRRPHGRKDPGGYIKDMVLIADRPAEIEDPVPGHWEGDLRPVGDRNVGRASDSLRDVWPSAATRPVTMCARSRRRSERCRHLAVSLTWDRGKEMARPRQFSIATGVHVYFCDPSWQRDYGVSDRHLIRRFSSRPQSSCAAAMVSFCRHIIRNASLITIPVANDEKR